MRQRILALLLGGLALSIFIPVQSSILLATGEHLTQAALVVLAAAFFSPFLVGLPSLRPVRQAGTKQWAFIALTGTVLVGLAHGLTYALRFGYAPSWTNVLLMLCTAPLFYLVFSAAGRLPSARRLLLPVLLCTIATAGVLGSWEVPSTLTPFARWPLEDGMIMAAAAALALGLRLSDELTAEVKRAGFSLICLTGALLTVATALFLEGPAAFSTVAATTPWASLTAAGLFLALFYRQLLVPGEAWQGRAVAPLSLFFAILVMTVLHIPDQIIGLWGESPFRLARVVTGCVIILAGLVCALQDRRQALGPAFKQPVNRYLAVASGLALAVAATGLFLPMLRLTIDGTLDSGKAWHGTWTFLGCHTVGGWLALVLAGAMVVMAARAEPYRYGTSVLIFLSAVSLPIIGPNPLAYWTDAVPGEVLHAFETEFVSMGTVDVISQPLMNPFWVIAVGLLIGVAAYRLHRSLRPAGR